MIKTVAFSLLLLGGSYAAFAQNSPNRRLWVGVNATPGFTANGAYSVAPRLGYLVNNRILAGVEGRFGKVDAPFWGAGVFGRYYVGNGKVLPFAHVGLSYEVYQKPTLPKEGAVVVRPGIGLRFGRVENRFGVELLVEKPLTPNANVRELGNLKNQVGISLGVQYRF